MTLEVAQGIADAAADLGVDVRVNKGYSGRGMFGKKTTGLVYNNWRSLLQAVAEYSARAINEGTNFDDLMDDLRDLSEDNLGREIIIY